MIDVCANDDRSVLRTTSSSSSENSRIAGHLSSGSVSPLRNLDRRQRVFYVSSPSYPLRYSPGLNCRWTYFYDPDAIAVTGHRLCRSRVVVEVTLLDLELDVRRSSVCHDLLEISSSSSDDEARMNKCYLQ